MDNLIKIRNEIDQLDQKLLNLISQRLELVKQVGEIKHQQGLPVYAPEREQTMLTSRRQDAEKIGVPADLIEDILRRLMRESYQRENKSGFKKVNPAINKIVIVGGKGKLGRVFAHYLGLSGYQIEILEQQDWQQAEHILANADMVMLSVPIANTLEVLERLRPFLTENMLLTDLTSVKQQPLAKMLEVHSGAVLGLHPMFGPDISSMAKQVIIACDGRNPASYQWLLQQMAIWGAKIEQVDAKQQDHYMTYIQALRHFTTFVSGLHLSKQQVQLADLLALSSPIYRLELAMIGRLFAQDGNLYADIIMDKPENLAVIESLQQSYQQALGFVAEGNKEDFVQAFNQVRDWFGDYSNQFLKESKQLLQQAQDIRPVS